MKNQILDLMLSRRTTHSYKVEPVPKAVIEDAVRVGIHAPNHKNTLPWRFYWLGQATRQKLGQVNPKFTSPGEMLVLAIKRSADPVQSREDYAAMACAVQNMSLLLHQMGYGSKWSTGKLMKTEGLYEAIGAQEGEIEICGIFWIGKADPQAPVANRPDRSDLSAFLKFVD